MHSVFFDHVLEKLILIIVVVNVPYFITRCVGC